MFTQKAFLGVTENPRVIEMIRPISYELDKITYEIIAYFKLVIYLYIILCIHYINYK